MLLVGAVLASVATPARAQDLPASSFPPSGTPASAPPAGAASDEPVLEALFLPDAAPPGGRDLNLSLVLARAEADAAGHHHLVGTPHLQLAQALGPAAGFTADVSVEPDGGGLMDPGASLKLLLRDPAGGRTGVAASIDWVGSFGGIDGHEAALGLGVVRVVGPLTWRASGILGSPVTRLSPHGAGGVSAAAALGARVRALVEVSTAWDADGTVVRASPVVKTRLSEAAFLMVGASLRVAGRAADPLLVVQLTLPL